MVLSCGPVSSHLLAGSCYFTLLKYHRQLQDVHSDFPDRSTMYTPSGAQQDTVLCAAELFDIVEHCWFAIWMKSSLFLVFHDRSTTETQNSVEVYVLLQKEGDPDFLHCSSMWAKPHQLHWVVASWNCFI